MSAAWIAAFGLLWAVVGVMAVTILGVLRRVANVLEAAEARLAAHQGDLGASVRSIIPPFELFDGEGRAIPSEELVREPTVLLFMDSHCQACGQVAEQLTGIGASIDGIPFAVIMDDSPEGHEFPFPPGLRVLYQRDDAISHAFQNRATPQAYAIDEGGFVLARRVPESLVDLRFMAWFQREGGDLPTTSAFAPSQGSVQE